MKLDDIKIEIAPSNGRPQRLVVAKDKDRELHRDNVNTDSRRSRKQFIKELAIKVKGEFAEFDEALEPRIVAMAEAADAEAEAAAQEQRDAKRRSNQIEGALPSVLLPGQASTITEAAQKLGKLMADTGEFYSRGGAVMRAVFTFADVHLEPLDPATACSDFERVARIMRYKEVKDGAVAIPAVASKSVAEQIIRCQVFHKKLPPINVLSRCPVLIERGGRLVTITGYDRDSGIWATGKAPPEMSLHQARALLALVIADFQFAGPGDRARAFASLFTPALVFGGLLGGRAPIDLGEADDSQTGKGYRNKLTAAVYRNKPAAITQRERGGVGGLQESFDSVLASGALFPSLDNLRGKIEIAGLESFMTEDNYIARIPYARPMSIDPALFCVMMTTNKAELTRDKANRSSAVRILKQPQDYGFSRFPEGDLLAHVKANQEMFLGAVFTVAREWYRRGKPRLERAQHDFRQWATTLGWIVENLLDAGPLLDDHRAIQARISTPAESWLRDVLLAVRRAGKLQRPMRTHHLLDVVVTAGIATTGIDLAFDQDDKKEHDKACRALGRALKRAMNDQDEMRCDNLVVARRIATDAEGRSKTEYTVRRVEAAEESAILDALLRAVENGGGGRPKMVALGW